MLDSDKMIHIPKADLLVELKLTFAREGKLTSLALREEILSKLKTLPSSLLYSTRKHFSYKIYSYVFKRFAVKNRKIYAPSDKAKAPKTAKEIRESPSENWRQSCASALFSVKTSKV